MTERSHVKNPQSEAHLRRKARVAFIVAVFLTGLLGFLSWRTVQQAGENADWVARTHEVSEGLEDTLRHSLEVETAGRGFAETGKDAFLEPYQSARKAVARDLDELRLLVVEPEQAQRLKLLEALANNQVARVEEIVAARRTTGEVPTLVWFDRGKQVLDSVRITVDRMEVAETGLLERRTRRARSARQFAGFVSVAGSLLGVVFLTLAGSGVVRQIGISARAREQVKALNADLERRVEQRTEALKTEAAARTKTEAKLRASEEVFRLLLDGIRDYAIYMVDPEGRVVSWNLGAARIKGYQAEEIIGQHAACFYTETDRGLNRPQEALRTAAHTGRFEEEGWRVRKDGSKFWADAVITPLYEPNGAVRGYSKVVRDITDRKRTDDELHKQAALLDLALDAIIVRDLENRVLFWNRGARDAYGWTKEEATGRVAHDLLQTKFPIALSEIETALRRKGDWEGELRHIKRDGAEVLVASRWSLQRDAEGAPTAILEINRDITARKQAEDALSESEGRLAGIISSAMDAIITVDSQQRILVFNAAAVRIFRYPETEILGQSIERLIPERYRAEHAAHILQFGATGTTNRAVGQLRALWAVRSDGEEFQIEASISQVEIGRQKMFTVILRDVTERKVAEETRERLAAVVDSSDDAIISKTLNGTITAWNRGAEKVFGYLAAEAVGKPMLMLMPPERFIEESDILGRIARGESVEHFETVRIRKDGRRIDVSATISPIRDSSGVIIGASKIARDITERKRAEEALREKEHLLSESQRIAHLGSWTQDLTDPTGPMTWSEELYSIYALSPDSFTPDRESFLKLIVPEERSAMRRWIEASAAGEKPGELVFRVVLQDGTIRIMNRRCERQCDSAGRPVRLAGTAQDITERRRAEDALRESEERFLAMANGIPQLAWMAEADGSIFWYNQRWYDYTGTTFEQMQGWAWQSVHDPGVLPKVLAEWKVAIATRQPFEMEFPLRGADGIFRAFLTRVMPVMDLEGRVVRWFGTNTDIAEIKQAQERLAAQAESLVRQARELENSREALEKQTLLFQLVLDSMGEGLIAADPQGRFLLWNDSANKLMGRNAEDLPSEQWTQHYQVYLPDGITPYPTDSLPLVRALRGESVQTELVVEAPGTEHGVFLEVAARPMNDAHGKPCGGVAVLRDITERKRAEAVLAEQAEELSRQAEALLGSQTALEAQTLMLQSVLDSMSEGLVATDELGNFILWNPAAERIVGLGPTNMSSEEWSKHYGLFLPDTVTPFPVEKNPLLRALHGEVGSAEMFLRNSELNTGVWIESSASPLKDKGGSLRGGVVAFRDITQRKTDEREIRKLNDELEDRVVKRTAQLEAANRELESFTHSVSHDLRAPLRHISGFASMIREEFGPTLEPQAQQYLGRIQDRARCMGELVDGLLNLARMGRQALHLRPTAMNSVVEEVLSILQAETDGRDVEWKIGDLPCLECDGLLIGQVFQNLISNAIKYSRPRTHAVIEIGQTEENGTPVIFVRDNGVGFSMKYANKLFGVFQRLHRAEDFEGTGVGLATVHRIIEKHGGRVWAEAECDRGATFYFTVGAQLRDSKR